jgi:cell wall-associated NlpC family hydrolase
MLCRRRGITIPRDAQPQADWSGAVPVERRNIEPGDLLYFGRSDRKITHTGMYIGNGEFIDATTNGKPIVQIDRLDEAPWTTLFVAARRLK